MKNFKEKEYVKYENGALIVTTPKGNIVVRTDCDDTYPGVSLTYHQASQVVFGSIL